MPARVVYCSLQLIEWEQVKLKLILLAVGTAVIVLSTAYAFWPDDIKQQPVVTKEITKPAKMNNDDPEKSVPRSKPSNASAEALSVPVTGDDSRQNWPAQVRLWDTMENDAPTTIDGVPATRLHVDPERLRQLHVGQTLELDIPHEGTTFEAKIASTHNDPGGVKVWRAELADGLEEAGVIITQGKVQTHLVIASEQGNYSVVIDNKTGESTLIDEAEINARQAPFDDGIVVGPPDESTLPSIN